jgi:hypothetical protein
MLKRPAIKLQETLEKPVNGFGSYKTAGEEGIFPGLLQQGIETLFVTLCKIITACLAFGYIIYIHTKART